MVTVCSITLCELGNSGILKVFAMVCLSIKHSLKTKKRTCTIEKITNRPGAWIFLLVTSVTRQFCEGCSTTIELLYPPTAGQ